MHNKAASQLFYVTSQSFSTLAMNLLRIELFDPCLLSSIQEDLLIKNILRTHDPDFRYKIDAGHLLLVAESTMHFISPKVMSVLS